MKYIKYSCFGIHNVNHIIVSKCKLSTGCPAETTYDLPYACHTIKTPSKPISVIQYLSHTLNKTRFLSNRPVLTPLSCIDYHLTKIPLPKMGNCNSLASSSSTTTNHRNPPPSNGGIKVLPPNASPPPRSQFLHHSSAAVGRVLGRPMEDVRNTYTFGREVGRGQFGVTYLVTHKETKQHFACKSIAKRKLINRDDIEDVLREVQIMHHLTGHRSTAQCR